MVLREQNRLLGFTWQLDDGTFISLLIPCLDTLVEITPDTGANDELERTSMNQGRLNNSR
jgi:hypothetical protein